MARKEVKSPAYQWYPKDILTNAEVAKLSLSEEGAYRRALDSAWLNDGIPSNPKELALIIGKGCTVKMAEKVLFFFKKKKKKRDTLFNHRQEVERTKQQIRRKESEKKGKKGAEKRWRGGLKDKPLHSSATNQPMPKDGFSSSIASSNSIYIGETEFKMVPSKYLIENDELYFQQIMMSAFTGMNEKEVLAEFDKRYLMTKFKDLKHFRNSFRTAADIVKELKENPKHGNQSRIPEQKSKSKPYVKPT